MSSLDLGNNESLFYLHTPSSGHKLTLVFINALVGQTEMWEGLIGETLRDQGYGHFHIISGGKSIVSLTPLKN